MYQYRAASNPLLFAVLVVFTLLTHPILSLPDVVDGTDATCSSEIFPVNVFTTFAENTPTWKLGMIGLYPQTSAQDGAMMRFAVDYINQKTDILTNVTLVLYEADTTGSLVAQSTTIASVAEIIIDGVRGFVGGSNLVVMQSATQACNDFLVPHVGTTVQDASISVKATYPYMLRANTPYKEQTMAVVQMFQYFGWSSATIMTTSDTYGLDAASFLLTAPEPKAAGIKFKNVGISSGIADWTRKGLNLYQYLATSKVVIMMTNSAAGFPFIEYMLNTYNVSGVGNDIVYILGQAMCQTMLTNDPAYSKYFYVVDGTICMFPRGGDVTSPLYQSMFAAWQSANQTLYPGSRNPASFDWYGVDGVFAHAYAVNAMQTAKQNLNTVKGSTYLAALQAVQFTGTTGPFSFDTVYDRRSTWDLYNVVRNNVTNATTTTRKGWYRWTESTLTNIPEEQWIFWGGRLDVPVGNATIPAPNVTAGPTRPPPTPAPIIPVYRQYKPGFGGAMGAVIGVCVLVAIFASVVQALNWSRFSRHGPFYCGVIVAGVFVAYAAALTLVPEPTDALCMAFPWLLGVAFNLVYGCLFIKTWVLYGVFRKAAKLKKTNLTPFYILKVLSAFIAVEAVLMIVWTLVDPPTVRLAKLSDHSYEYQCKGDTTIFWIVFLCYKGVWLIFGSVLSFLTRNMAQEYNESKSIAYAIYADIVLIIIAVPLAISIKDLEGGVIIVQVVVIALAFTFTLVILFWNIWQSIFFGTDEGPTISPSNSRTTGSKTSNKSGSSQNNNSSQSSDGPPTPTVAYNPPPVSSSGLYLA